MNEYNLIIEARNKNEQAINLLLSKDVKGSIDI